MRFSLGPKTHEQTAAFLETVIGWHRAGLPSPFAVVIRSDGVLVGYCGFLYQEVDGAKEIEIGYRLILVTGTEASPPRRREKCVITP
jgi:RimJ/RimL family protein N-acetyltransferase